MLKRAFLVIILMGLVFNLYSINELTVQDPDRYGSKPGFIDEATLVVEPHGGHTEQSLYLEYSDHGQFPGNDKIEIVHRFELPQGSVINDLWLWIEDSVMQAIMMDTWSARAVYDSIVDVKRDPAFLSKKGNQYELHIYPLESGSYRKIKMNFITPTRWRGETGTAELPLKMLNSNNNPTNPLEILFRTRQPIWGQPRVLEQPDLAFVSLTDTLGYHFKHCRIADVGIYDHLNIEYQTGFENGYFFAGNQSGNDPSYFQLGLLPAEFFNLSADTSGGHCLVGLDLSGLYNKDLSITLPNITSVLQSHLCDKDRFQLMVTGAGKFKKVTDAWFEGTDENIKGVLSEFEQSDLAQEIDQQKLPHIIYCDKHAATCWRFPNIEELATYERFSSINSALNHLSACDIIAAYDHGHEATLSNEQLDLITATLDTFFQNGGRLLSFYDYNRVNKEKLASYYIPGLTTHKKIKGDLYRNPQGNIGRFFPQSLYHHVINLLEYDDPDVKIELMDKNGNPAVISKKIKNGLLVVSGIWSFKDDGALRALLGVPLLGLNAVSSQSRLVQLLDEIQALYSEDPFERVVLFSNSDSVISATDAESWSHEYLNRFPAGKLVINSINLLDGSRVTPPYITESGIDYFGSGLLLKSLADRTRGLSFETHINDWDFIAALMSPFSAPKRKKINISVSGDAGENALLQLSEVDPIPNDPNKPIFYIGSSSNKISLQFDISAQFMGLDSGFTRQLTVPLAHDTTAKGDILPAMLGFEALKERFEHAAGDTAEIVDLAMQYNLLCDYTALIALEPNDTLHFMQNPFKEDELLTEVETENKSKQDSLGLDIYPNPFNAQTTIALNIPFSSEVRLNIYNIRGQRVKTLCNQTAFKGSRTLIWDGRNNAYQPVSSGIYFVRAQITNNRSRETLVRTRRVVLIR